MAPTKYEPRPATVRELRARVKSYEAELKDTTEQLNDVLQSAVDWKSHVEKHPVRFAIGAAAMGLAVGLKPSFIPSAGNRGIQAVLGLGVNALLRKLRARFM
jgi:hypothetical protein